MTDNFKEIGSLFGREGAGAGFAKQTDKESFTYAFAWPEGDTWATLTGYLNLDEQPVATTSTAQTSRSRTIRFSNPATVEKVPPKSARLSVWKPGFSLNRPLPL